MWMAVVPAVAQGPWIRIEDPLGLLPKSVDGALGSRVRVGVIYRSGAYQGLTNSAVDNRGRDYVLAVPDDEPLSVWVAARGLTVSDEGNKALGQPALIPLQVGPGQDRCLTFTITGPKS